MSQVIKFNGGAGGGEPIESITPDAGIIVVPDGTGNVNIVGGANINTFGSPNTLTINLDDNVTIPGNFETTGGNIYLPNTNTAGTEGIIHFGGNRWISNYGTSNTFVGQDSGNTDLTGSGNTALGRVAGILLEDGFSNTLIGDGAGIGTINGTNNTAVGTGALFGDGSFNIAIGSGAGAVNARIGSSNIMIGNIGVAADENTIRIGTSGSDPGEQDKTYIAGIYGRATDAPRDIVVIDSNDKLGTSGGTVAFEFIEDAGSATPAGGILNILGGSNINTSGAGSTVTINLNNDVTISGTYTTTTGNIVIPNTNGAGTQGVIIQDGDSVLHNFGDFLLAGANIFVGRNAGNFTNTSNYMVGIGDRAGNSITGATTCTLVGGAAGESITSGSNNLALGFAALTNLVTGARNIALGSNVGSNYTTNESDNIIIRNAGVALETNTMRLGTSGTGVNQVNASYLAGIYGRTYGATSGVMIIDNGDKVGSSNGTNGQLLIGGGTGPVWANLTSGGGSITITNGANSINLESAAGGFTWTEVTGTTVALVGGNGYIMNNAGLVTGTLPATATVGSIIAIVGKGAGLWSIAQRAGQTIHFGNVNTTTGVGGSLTATNRYDCVELICTTADTDFVVRSSIGNITYV